MPEFISRPDRSNDTEHGSQGGIAAPHGPMGKRDPMGLRFEGMIGACRGEPPQLRLEVEMPRKQKSSKKFEFAACFPVFGRRLAVLEVSAS
jgi:hypothetical protein